MKVKDLILYQVATDRNYKVGDKLVTKTLQMVNLTEFLNFRLSLMPKGRATFCMTLQSTDLKN